MKIHEEMVTIYALCEPSNKRKIRYVGQTVQRLGYRMADHSYLKPERRGLEPRVLRRVKMSDASRLEVQIIRACKQRGLADLNKLKAGCTRSPCVYNPVLYVEQGLVFYNTGHAARFFNCCPQSIHKAANGVQALDEGCTLKWLPEQLVWGLLQ